MTNVDSSLTEAMLARVPVETLAPLVDAFMDVGTPASREAIRVMLGAITDDYPPADLLDTVLAKLESSSEWVEGFFDAASEFGKAAPSTFELQLSRILNRLASAERLSSLMQQHSPSTQVLLTAVREISKNPKERPGGSARRFLSRLGNA